MKVLVEVYENKWLHVTPLTLELTCTDYKGQMIRVDGENDLSILSKEIIKSEGYNFVKLILVEDLMYIDFQELNKDDYIDITGIIWFSRKMGKSLRLLVMVD